MKLKELIHFRLYSGDRLHRLAGCWNVKITWNENLKYGYDEQNRNMKRQSLISRYLKL